MSTHLLELHIPQLSSLVLLSLPLTIAVLLSTSLSRSPISHGVHTAAQSGEAPRIQILGSRPFLGIEIHTQAILYECRYQMLSHVNGVSRYLLLRFRFATDTLSSQAESGTSISICQFNIL